MAQNYELPAHATIYPLQVAGHLPGEGKTKLGFLKHENGNVLKPLIKGDKRSTTELMFYERVFENDKSDSLLLELKKFLPKFSGTWETTIAGKDIRYLCLEDVCEQFQKPSVLDIKMGRKTYDPEASEEKIRAEETKYPAGEILGFRILGMKVYDDSKQLYICKDKSYGKEQTPETIVSALDQYLSDNHGQINSLILCGFLHNLLHLADWFSEQRLLAFYASSLLFAYEGMVSSWTAWIQNNVNSEAFVGDQHYITHNPYHNNTLDSNMCKSHIPSYYLFPEVNTGIVCSACGLNKNVCTNIQNNCSLYRIVMIDFAHTFQTTKEDSNYIFGLTVLIEKLKDLLKLYKEKHMSL